jgi:hypothetical protein
MAVVIPTRSITAPSITPLAGTLLDAANLVSGIAWLDPDNGLFESYNCLVTDREATWPCPGDVVTGAKTFSHPDWMDGVKFAVYAGVECKLDDSAEELASAQRVFEARESVGVERAFMETLLQGATDVTPAGGPVVPEVGLAILEGHAATTYAGVPTIHAPRSIGSILMTRTAAHSEGGAFYTEQGSKLASGGGYNATNLSPAGAAPAAGSLWMYATGEVVVARGDVVAKNDLNRVTNETRVLVERPYVAAIDCYKSAVRVTVA